MKKADEAISLGIATLVIIALIVIVGFGVYLNSTFNTASTSIVGTKVNPSKGREFQVSFEQIAVCNPPFWGVPWAVTIGNETKVEPPSPLPLDNYSIGGTVSGPLFINFTLANGTYSYVVTPSGGFFTPTFGSVTVAGSNVTVPIKYTGTSCTETLNTNTDANSSGNSGSSSQSTNTSTSSLLSSCTTTFQNGLNPSAYLKLKLEQNASLQVCVKYYYYNSSTIETLNFSNWNQLIEISSQLRNGSINSADNFTVTSSLRSATLGGPYNEGEGTSLIYTITPRVYGNRTYGFNFGWLYPSTEACGQDFLLSTGNGTSYPFTGCTAPLSSICPVNSQGFVSGFLFAEIIGVSNSTQ